MILLSDIRSDKHADRVIAAQVTFGNRRVRGGVTALTGDIEKRGDHVVYNERVLGAHVRSGTRGRRMLAETALSQGGASAQAIELLWPLSRGQLHARAWSYSDQFINPWGGGPGHADTRKALLAEIEEEYSSRTAGERGLDLSTRWDFSTRTSGRWEWMAHRESPDARLEYQSVARLRIRAGRTSLTPFARGRMDDAGAETFAFGGYGEWTDGDRQLNARVEFGRHRADADRFVRIGAGAKWSVNRIVHLAPAVRWVDPDVDTPGDGYWYFYCTETVLPVAGARLEAALVWQHYEDRGRADRVELRIRSFINQR
jgi:hypothetical protein